MLANNEVGTIQPIRELAEIAHDFGALFHTDAVQAAGKVPISVKDLGIDMMSISSHKINGPKGVWRLRR
jgi:cysteine desulfurase